MPKYLQSSRHAFIQLLFCLVSILCLAQSKNEFKIQGKLQLDSIWEPVAYLSHISSFNDMFTMSNQMIIAESKIDSSGNFSFASNLLPRKDNLYRLHISKRDAPAASLIIGGAEENHIFLIANSKTKLSIANLNSQKLFENLDIEGYQPNLDLLKINTLLDAREALDIDKSSANKEVLENEINEELRKIADTSSHSLVSLYALYNSQFESTYLANKSFYENYLHKWKKEDSAYLNELRSLLSVQSKTPPFWYIIFGLLFFGLGYLLHYLFGQKRKSSKQLRSLSIQERKIFELIRTGKSNKEISEEYNIGLSTVKSHVSNIYSKLNIKSRKEAMDLK